MMVFNRRRWHIAIKRQSILIYFLSIKQSGGFQLKMVNKNISVINTRRTSHRNSDALELIFTYYLITQIKVE